MPLIDFQYQMIAGVVDLQYLVKKIKFQKIEKNKFQKWKKKKYLFEKIKFQKIKNFFF